MKILQSVQNTFAEFIEINQVQWMILGPTLELQFLEGYKWRIYKE